MSGYALDSHTSTATPFQGSLFAQDFLRESVTRLDDWRDIDTVAFETVVRDVFARFPVAGSPNESQTEDDLIWTVLAHLGWTASLRQQNLSAAGRQDVPDGLLFQDDPAKDRANGCTEEWKRYAFGLAVVESKRWRRPLDRRSDRPGEDTAPSTQMLRYLRRVDDLTTGALRWGILTNCAQWRLYYQGARSVSEQFFELDLAAILDLPGHNEAEVLLSEITRNKAKDFQINGSFSGAIPGWPPGRTGVPRRRAPARPTAGPRHAIPPPPPPRPTPPPVASGAGGGPDLGRGGRPETDAPHGICSQYWPAHGPLSGPSPSPAAADRRPIRRSADPRGSGPPHIPLPCRAPQSEGGPTGRPPAAATQEGPLP